MKMDEVYLKIFELAKLHYEKGRPQDISHIEWIMQKAEDVSEKENLDGTILIPLAILHDIGYSKFPKDNSYKEEIRKLHMEKGAELSKEILEEVNYPKDKLEKIVYYVSIHDSWALGNNEEYNKDILLGTFNDLDFLWLSTKEGFESVRKMIGKNPKEMYNWISEDEKLKLRPLKTKTIKENWEKNLSKRKLEIGEKE